MGYICYACTNTELRVVDTTLEFIVGPVLSAPSPVAKMLLGLSR